MRGVPDGHRAAAERVLIDKDSSCLLQRVATRMEESLGEERNSWVEDGPPDPARLPLLEGPIVVGINGGYVRAREPGRVRREANFEVVVGQSIAEDRDNRHFGLVQSFDDLEDVPTTYPGIKAFRRSVDEFHTYVRRNVHTIPNYAERHRYSERVSTAFAESTVNAVVGKCFAKRQQRDRKATQSAGGPAWNLHADARRRRLRGTHRRYQRPNARVLARTKEPTMTGTENLVLEHLRAIRATVERTERELGDVRRRVGSIEQHLANLQSDVANLHLRLDHQGERLDRIERRLEIADAPG